MKTPRAGYRKYRNRPATVDGIRFDSQREAGRWTQLRAMELAGAITDLERQVKIPLIGKCGPLLTRTGRKMKLTVDFGYYDRDRDAIIYEDAKGMPTRDYEVRRAVAQAMGYTIEEV